MSVRKYAQLLKNLLPRGVIWRTEEGSVLERFLSALAEEFARFESRAMSLIAESDPRSALELLADWERIAGLPDKCSAGRATTVQERRDAVVAKLTMMGGASPAFFIALARQYGYEIDIEEFAPFICGLNECGDQLYSESSVYVWRVSVPGPRFTPFVCGASECGDLLGKITWAEDLECKFTTIKPAHTKLTFSYEGN